MKLDEVLRRHKGKWALMSRKNPNKVLQYYHGSGRPSKEWVSKVEKRIHSFSENLDFSGGTKSLDFSGGNELPKKRLHMEDYAKKYSHLMALAILHFRPHFKLRARVGWYSETEEERLIIDHIYTLGPSGSAYDARGKFDNEKQLLNWYWRPEYTVAQIIDLTVSEVHSMIQSRLLKKFDDRQFEDAKMYIEKTRLFKKNGNAQGRYKEHIMSPLYGTTYEDIPKAFRTRPKTKPPKKGINEAGKFTFPLTSKQQVIDYFVSRGRPAGVGAAAWERGWRQPKSPKGPKGPRGVTPRPHWMDNRDD